MTDEKDPHKNPMDNFNLEEFIIFFNQRIINKEIILNRADNWKVDDRAPPTDIDHGEALPARDYAREAILEPLDGVFLDDALMDDIVVRTGIPDLFDGSPLQEREEANYSGVILYGPSGTGKTVLQKAICEVYRRAGAYSREVSTSTINSAYVGQFARNLEQEFVKAVNEVRTREKPSFLSFDEASILAQRAVDGAVSVSKHYQEAMDVFKRYIGNHRELVVAISTNLLPESFEEAMTREGRLTPFFIGYPGQEQRRRMWEYFLDRNALKGALGEELTPERVEELASLTDGEQGALIEEFCRGYEGIRRAAILRERGFRTLVEALKHETNVTPEQVHDSINYAQLRSDLEVYLQSKQERNGQKKRIGFGN